MTFEELQTTLPNGFHDAELRAFAMDYGTRTLRFELDVWIGEMEDKTARELYRPARVTCEEVAFLMLESPDSRYPWGKPGSIRIDAGAGNPPQSKSEVPAPPAGTETTWIYLVEFNRFLLFAANSASLEWTGAENNRGTARRDSSR